MSLTKKFGTLLFLLATGSLIATAAFVSFFLNTTYDGLYLMAAQIEAGLLQELKVNTLKIREGDDTVRATQLKVIRGFNSLIRTMESGGKQPVRPLVLASRLPPQTSDPGVEVIAQYLEESLPRPTEDLRVPIATVRELWEEIREPLVLIAEKPADDAEARAAYAEIQPKLARIDNASRQVLVRVFDRITEARERMLATLAAIGGLSIALLIGGLWFIKRYISRPIERMERAARQIHAGNYKQNIPVVSQDELASLGTAINEMSVEIERAVEQYRELFENASDLIYTVDLEGKVLSVNKAVERVTGYARDELMSMNMSQLVSKEQLEVTQQMRRRKLSGEQEMTVYPLQLIAKNGRTVTVEASTRLIYENGKPIAVQGTARDITERRRLEEQLWTAQKMEAVGRLAGGIAHEFGNVLTIITGYCALLMASLKKDDPLREEVDGIQKATQRAASLIRHLLGFSKGQLFRPRVIDLRESLPQMSDMLLRLVGEDIELSTTCAPDVGYIRFDPAQLEQVLVNLTLNSRDAMPSGGKLTIRADNMNLVRAGNNGSDSIPAGTYVRLTVEDTGAGMTPEVRSRMFEPFFSTKERGTGLGLATVYGIVRQSGGTVSVGSEVNKGTTFTILLPRYKAADQMLPKEDSPATTVKGSETILLVEDQPDVRWLIRQMLAHLGYKVIEATDQQDAISVCSQRERQIDLMLTDVVMPAMSGPELAAHVRPLRPDMKILYMSGHAQDKFASYIENEESFEFIQKPVMADVLAAKVREVLDMAPGRRVDSGA